MKKTHFSTVAICMAVTFALLLFVLSLRWPVVHDLPIMLYEGFLVHDAGLVPYRDFFDINPPGTMLLYSAIHQITAGASFACRILDLSVLVAIGVFTCLALSRHGLKSGILATACFAAAYLSGGAILALQREYLCVLPLAMSIALVFRTNSSDAPRWYSLFLCGILAGVVLTIKPPMILCWVPLMVKAACFTGCDTSIERRRFLLRLLKTAILVFSGMLLPILLVAGWLSYNHALAAFLDMARHYYPLYAEIDGSGMVRSAGVVQLLKRYRVEMIPLLLCPFSIVACLGVSWGSRMTDRRLRTQNAILFALVLCALLYVFIGGKFWPYHKFPLYYCVSLCAGMTLSRGLLHHYSESRWRAAILCVAIATSLPFASLGQEFLIWREGKTHEVKKGHVSLVSSYLQKNATLSDTIMPLDVTSGAIHALYKIRRPLYGRFIYDFHFYHHTSTQYILDLRKELISQFRDDKPSLVLKFESWRPHGAGCSDEFSELDAILREDYVTVLQTKGCSIMRRKTTGTRRVEETRSGFRVGSMRWLGHVFKLRLLRLSYFGTSF